MFTEFEAHFHRDEMLSCHRHEKIVEPVTEPELRELFLRYGGASFNRGLYRVMTTDSRKAASTYIARAFPDFSRRVKAFAHDWLGRLFALDLERYEGGSSAVVMLEPGTGEVLELPCGLLTLHESELVHHGEEALAASFHKQWLTKGGVAPRFDQCIGYKRPLFLGGNDTIQNLELSDLDVYWHISAQLIQKMRGLGPGTLEN